MENIGEAAKVIETLTVNLIHAVETLPDKLVEGLPGQRERIATAVLAALVGAQRGTQTHQAERALHAADALIEALRRESD